MSTPASVLRISTRAVAAIVSVVLLVVLGYAWKNVHDLNAGAQTLPGIRGLGEPAAPQPGGTLSPPPGGQAMNILVVGNDDRTDMTDAEVHQLHTGRSGGSINTDTMMIIHVPADGSKATIISLPRDSYVDIPGYLKSKLNAAYPDGYVYGAPSGATLNQRRAAGASVLIKTVSNLTGLTIDHFVEVDLIGFYRISEAIGPITVDLCHATSDPTGSHFTAAAGPLKLVGVRALEFVRQRDGLAHGDVSRTARQRYFLAAAFRRIENLGFLAHPGKLHQLIRAIDSSIYTDGKDFSIVQLAAQVADLNPDQIVGKVIPTEGNAPVDIGGQQSSVLRVDPAKVRRFVANLLNGTHTPHGGGQRSDAKPLDKGCID